MKLYLVEGFTRPKAKHDDIFLLKQGVTNFCLTLARYRHRMPDMIPELKRETYNIIAKSRVRRFYYEMVHSIDFDRIIYNKMQALALEEREGYYLMEFSKVIVDLANELELSPHHLTPPLYYNDKGKIDTLFTGQFYGRIQLDDFRHPVLIVRNEGVEKYFATFNPIPQPFYPVWTIPHLTAQRPEEFLQHDTTFRQMYEVMKGLFNLWFGLKF